MSEHRWAIWIPFSTAIEGSRATTLTGGLYDSEGRFYSLVGDAGMDLIAAAPAMLATLEELAAIAGPVSGSRRPSMDARVVLNRCNAAIAKAKGAGRVSAWA